MIFKISSTERLQINIYIVISQYLADDIVNRKWRAMPTVTKTQ